MTAVEVHGIWERYAEARLVAALNHRPAHFLDRYEVKGVSQIPVGLAQFIIRGGERYFNFRSIGELASKGDQLLGKDHNPFRLSQRNRLYLNALSAIRNRIVHSSNASIKAYKEQLNLAYGTKSPSSPGEFLIVIDRRQSAPIVAGHSRLHGLIGVVRQEILT